MKAIELLAQTVNILIEFLNETGLACDSENQSWLDRAEDKLKQEGYSVVPFTSRWTKDT